MKVLIIGSGGREHALAWKLKQSKKIQTLYCAPGNAGMMRIAKCINIKADDIERLAEFASSSKINLTVVGPEQPLALGLTDEFKRRKLKVFGPEKSAARLESSKAFAKGFLQRYHIPTAAFKVFDNLTEAIGFCKSIEFPTVIKIDGLAAGKGVMIVHNLDQAAQTLEQIFVDKKFGDAGAKVVIESCLKGQEVSIMIVTDGKTFVPLLPSQDHKQALDGDQGPNTGGMGAYCPVEFITEKTMAQITQFVLEPVIAGLRKDNIAYKGVLYAGLMLTDAGPKVLEFNCRFGDPETQAVLPLLKTDLLELMKATVDGQLEKFPKLEWRRGSAACVIMASKGYPGEYSTGLRISGLQNVREDGAYVFHSGTRKEDNQWLTAGGRVLGVMGMDASLKAALAKAYRVVKRIRFDGVHYRRDIGFRVLGDQKREENA
jgi:phosphoribosylamine---glycine ligase